MLSEKSTWLALGQHPPMPDKWTFRETQASEHRQYNRGKKGSHLTEGWKSWPTKPSCLLGKSPFKRGGVNQGDSFNHRENPGRGPNLPKRRWRSTNTLSFRTPPRRLMFKGLYAHARMTLNPRANPFDDGAWTMTVWAGCDISSLRPRLSQRSNPRMNSSRPKSRKNCRQPSNFQQLSIPVDLSTRVGRYSSNLGFRCLHDPTQHQALPWPHSRLLAWIPIPSFPQAMHQPRSSMALPGTPNNIPHSKKI